MITRMRFRQLVFFAASVSLLFHLQGCKTSSHKDQAAVGNKPPVPLVAPPVLPPVVPEVAGGDVKVPPAPLTPIKSVQLPDSVANVVKDEDKSSVNNPGMLSVDDQGGGVYLPVPDFRDFNKSKSGLNLDNSTGSTTVDAGQLSSVDSFFNLPPPEGQKAIILKCVDPVAGQLLEGAAIKPTDLVWRYYIRARTAECKTSDTHPKCQTIASADIVVQLASDDPGHNKCPGVINRLSFFDMTKRIYLHAKFIREQFGARLRTDALANQGRAEYSEAISDSFLPGQRKEVVMQERKKVTSNFQVVETEEPDVGTILAVREDGSLFTRTRLLAKWDPYLVKDKFAARSVATTSDGSLVVVSYEDLSLHVKASKESAYVPVNPQDKKALEGAPDRDYIFDVEILDNDALIALPSSFDNPNECTLDAGENYTYCGAPISRVTLFPPVKRGLPVWSPLFSSSDGSRKLRAIAGINGNKTKIGGFDYVAIDGRYNVIGRSAESTLWSPLASSTKMTDIAVMQDGTIIGIGKNDKWVYYYQDGNDPDTDGKTGWIPMENFNSSSTKMTFISLTIMKAKLLDKVEQSTE